MQTEENHSFEQNVEGAGGGGCLFLGSVDREARLGSGGSSRGPGVSRPSWTSAACAAALNRHVLDPPTRQALATVLFTPRPFLKKHFCLRPSPPAAVTNGHRSIGLKQHKGIVWRPEV